MQASGPPAPSPAENPYAPPLSDTALADTSGGRGDLTDEEIRAFVGENHDYYRGKWARANRTGGFYAGFNVAALIVSTLWLLFRKMYLAFAVLFLAQVAVMFVAAVAGSLLGGDASQVMIGVFAGLAVTKVTIGFLGNGLYLRRARRAVGAARLRGSIGESNVPYLVTQGGTSMAAVAVGILANIVVNLITR